MKVLLVHWNEAEAGERLAALHKAGFDAVWFGNQSDARMKHVAQASPDVILIDLSRLPYMGKYFAEAVRKAKSTRDIPLVFAGGPADKVAAIREAFPQDQFCSPKSINTALKKSSSLPPAAYSPKPQVNVPLAQKLNFLPGRKVYLRDAPREFLSALGEIPEGLEFLERPAGADMGMLFYDHWDHLLEEWDQLSALLRRFPVWIVYRKGSLKAHEIRAALKDSGFADYKVCAISPILTGILATVARKR